MCEINQGGPAQANPNVYEPTKNMFSHRYT